MEPVREPASSPPKPCASLKKNTNLARSPLLVALVGRNKTVVRHQLFPQKPPGSNLCFSRTGVQSSPGSSLPSPDLVRNHPIKYYQALRDSGPCLSRAATLPKGTKLELGRGAHLARNTILNQPYRRRVSTESLNRDGSQLAASLEGDPGPTPAGKTLPHSYPETRFRRERAQGIISCRGGIHRYTVQLY